ncbi:MAG: hypothetical protein IPK07_26880, partial [Deltaproteobacteria bacterium]|nr:hypothetical protein [Deltaproteobacteria bacterium]
IVFVRSESGTDDCAAVPLGRVYRMRWDPDEGDPEEAIRELPVALTDPDSDPTIQAACETWESGDVQLGDYDPEISPSPVKVRSDDTARMRVAFARRFDQVNLSANPNHTAFGDWDILVVDLEETTPEASVENITDWRDSGSTIYADQIPSWKDHSGVTDLTHRLAFSSVSSVPQDDRDIFTAAARTDVQDYVNAQPCGSGSGEPSCTEVDSYWDSAPTWIPARAEGNTESLPDLTFHRFDVGPGQYTGSLLNLLGFH